MYASLLVLNLPCSHAFKARINSRDELAEALEISYQQLKSEVQRHTDVDQELKVIFIIHDDQTFAYPCYHQAVFPPDPHTISGEKFPSIT